MELALVCLWCASLSVDNLFVTCERLVQIDFVTCERFWRWPPLLSATNRRLMPRRSLWIAFV